MTPQKCSSNIGTLQAFLNTTHTNWRESIYIECCTCKYEQSSNCGDFLFAPEKDGTPILLPTCDANMLYPLAVDKSECLGIMTNHRFLDLYKEWFKHMDCEPTQCPLQHAVKELHKPEHW